MPAAKYTSFQIKNTALVPMTISFTDSDGDSYSIGPIDPGNESIQVAPIGTTWKIEFVSSDATREGSDAVKEGSDATKEGSDATKEGSDAIKEGSDATKEGSDATKEGSDAVKEGSDATK